MNSLLKKEVLLVIVYKYIVNTLGFILGVILLCFRGDLIALSRLFDGEHIAQLLINMDLRYYRFHMKEIDALLIGFGILLVIFALLELVCTTALLYRKKWGAIGLIVVSALWLLIDIFFIIKIFTFTKFVFIIINILIIVFLVKLVHQLK